MNILLLNLTRFGDLLQSQAAVADLKRQGHRVGLVCLENFMGAASLLKGLDYAFALPGGALLGALHDAGSAHGGPQHSGPVSPGWHRALASLGEWRENIHAEFTPDAVCNLTPSLAARLLSLFLARGAVCWGFALDEQGYNADSTAWAAFMQASSAERGVSPFNVTDMFRKAAHSWPQSGSLRGDASLTPPPQDMLAAMRARMVNERQGNKAREEGQKACEAQDFSFVALQLGASEERRRWPLEYFAELGGILWREAGVIPVLLGNAKETVLADRYAALADHPFVNLCGKTDLRELAAALCSVRLLVTNDTGTMHLAAGLGRPVLAVFLATAQPCDTGPYLEGSCCLEPDLNCHPCRFGTRCEHSEACRHAVTPNVAARLALSSLREGAFQVNTDVAGARVWLSHSGENGFMGLMSLSGHENEPRTVWLRLLSHHLRRFLDKEGAFQAEPCPQAPLSADGLLDEVGPVIKQALALLDLMRQQSRVLEVKPLPVMRERFISTWGKVRETLLSCPRLKPLSLLWSYLTQAPGLDLPDVGAVAGDFSTLLQGILADMGERE